MRFIRAFWGDLRVEREKYVKELQTASLDKSLNEVVYVWGEENNKFISSLGYQTVLVSKDSSEFNSIDIKDGVNFFLHKYKALSLAIQQFGKVLLLDWDVDFIKPIDSNFYDTILKQNSELQIPIYNFPIEGYMEYMKMRSPKLVEQSKYFIESHYKSLSDYGWKTNVDLFVPCTCFIYCSDVQILDDFRKLAKELNTFSDEGVWAEWGRRNGYDTVDGWIQSYEPLVCNAKYDWHFNQKELNEYMSGFIQKDLYFIHK